MNNKFRAWNKFSKRMMLKQFYINNDGIAFVNIDPNSVDMGGKVRIVPTADLEIMQYTGIKDKQGRDIYDGDIVSGPSDSATVLRTAAKNNKRKFFNWRVEWYNNGWHLTPLGEMERTWPLFEETEIIGNIYENPELNVK